MGPSDEQRRWIEIGLFTGAAILLYQVRAAFFLSAVPLFLLGFRRGGYAQLYGAGLFLLAAAVEIILRLRGFAQPQLVRFFFLLEIAYPASLVAGILVVQWRGGRMLYRLLEAVVLVGVVSLPLILLYMNDSEVTSFLAEQIRLIAESLQEAFSREGEAAGPQVMSGDAMVRLVKVLFFRNYLFSYFLLLSGMWALSDGIYRRTVGRAPFMLMRYTVPESFLWPLIGVWAAVLLDVLFGLGFIGYLVWNAGLILLFLYALQGIAVMKFLFRRHGVGTGLRIAVTVASVVILFTPGINLVLIVGVPLLGVSEYWIHYRIVEGE
jgi:hypothetical protein